MLLSSPFIACLIRPSRATSRLELIHIGVGLRVVYRIRNPLDKPGWG